MNTKYIVSLLFLTSITFAQIGVGTSTPNASAMLDLTSTSKGFLQPRVELTGTDDVATIATPATGLMVFNTATAGSGATGVSPGVYYHNGTAWQRVANQAEVAAATASTTTFVNGNLGTAWNGDMNGDYDPWTALGAKNFGASITLPPGKWEVKLDLNVDLDNSQTFPQPAPTWMNYWLDENTPTNLLYYQEIINGSTIGTADALFTGSASFVRPVGGVASNHSGVFYINNATQANKTYTLYFFESLPYNGCFDPNCIRIFYNKFGGTTGWPGNRFYATKIN
jgi:hypothetical protein